MEKRGAKSIGLFEIICLIVVILSSISVFLLTMHRFSPYTAISLSAILLLFIFLKYRDLFSLEKIWTKNNAALLLILLLALAFRYKPYLHTYGGIEDQGAYVLMSEVYSKTGSNFMHDNVRAKINDTELLKIYDSKNQYNAGGGERSWGFHIRNLKDNVYAFRFYPLHPLWMSIFSAVFGRENGVYSLLFFSLISIIASFLIVYELFDKKLAPATIAGAIIAVNPLHVYLSKIPVSEILVTAFVFSGLYFLLKWYKDSKLFTESNLHLSLSAMLLGCLFFTRITSFVYLPIFYFLTVTAILYFPHSKVKRNLLIYFTSIFVFYALSVLYAREYTPRYFLDVMISRALPKLLGSDWRTLLPYVLNFLILFCVILWALEGRQFAAFKRAKNFLNQKKEYLFYVALIFSVTYIGYASYQGNFASIHVFIEYLSFPLFLSLFPAAYVYSKRDIERFSLVLILMIVCLFYLPIVSTKTYQFFPRYLAEPIFFSIFLSVTFILDGIRKSKKFEVVGYALLIFVFLSFAYFSSHALRESPESLHTALGQIKEQIGDSDLLIIEKSEFRDFFEIKSSLDYFEDVNTFAVSKMENVDEKFSNYSKNYRQIFILSQRDKLHEADINQTAEIELILKTSYAQTIAGGKNGKLPIRHKMAKGNLFLYKLTLEHQD
jgi:hypothetical protein